VVLYRTGMKTLRVPPRARRRTGAAADALILD